ncbi:MAG: proline--tRNA ligase [Acidimicrobiales bacterium]|nr:proline--tRNA ligase [Acidimicrobiales bacterium]
MRQSKILIPTLKEDPSDADVVSHKLMVRAGMVRQLASGLYSWLPLGLRTLRKVEKIIREEMDKTGAQELLMPVVQPAELWVETGRWDKMGPELCRLKDRHERDFCLGPTHEEVVTDIFRREVNSYKDLPSTYYQIQTKFRDEPRPRFGLIRAREFIMKDAYSFHIDQANFNETYQKIYDCYSTILDRMHLDYRAVIADTGNIGGENSHEFHVLAQSGEDVIVYATNGTYAANLEKAEAGPLEQTQEFREGNIEEIHTPLVSTIQDVAKLLATDSQCILKTLFVEGDEGLVGLVLRGDHELNLVKAEKIPGIKTPLTFAHDEAILKGTGVKIGSLGPINSLVPIFVDREAAALTTFVCGANKTDYHFANCFWDRDRPLKHHEIVDIRNVVEGDPAKNGQGTLQFQRGIEVGHIFQLDRKYSEPMKANVLDEKGKTLVPIMGCYGMGVTRLVAALIEQNHDDNGIIWPTNELAPFHLHIIPINYDKSDLVKRSADSLYHEALSLGLEVLLDDRNERPGVKFADADLIGIPHRITVGERSLQNGCVEYVTRKDLQSTEIPMDEILLKIKH